MINHRSQSPSCFISSKYKCIFVSLQFFYQSIIRSLVQNLINKQLQYLHQAPTEKLLLLATNTFLYTSFQRSQIFFFDFLVAHILSSIIQKVKLTLNTIYRIARLFPSNGIIGNSETFVKNIHIHQWLWFGTCYFYCTNN